MKIHAMSDIHGCLDAFLDVLTLFDLEDKHNDDVVFCHAGADAKADEYWEESI